MMTVAETELSKLIAQCLNAKSGDKAFLLTSEDGKGWVAAIGNRSAHVGIGEIIGYGDDGVDFVVEADNPVDAVKALLQKITAQQ